MDVMNEDTQRVLVTAEGGRSRVRCRQMIHCGGP